MKLRFLILALIYTVVVVPAKSQHIDALSTKANELYRNQQYESALGIYDSIMDMGYESAMLFYNMGNVYYKLNEMPQAILYYEKALKLEPKYEKAQQNLAHAKLLTIDRVDEIPEFFLLSTFRRFIYALNGNVWAIISAIMFFVAMSAFLFFFLSSKSGLRRSGFYAGVILILFSAVTLYFACASFKNLTTHDSAVIMQSTVTLKGSPSENSSELYIVHEGTKVQVLDKVDNWYEVRLTDGKKGWVKRDVFELI